MAANKVPCTVVSDQITACYVPLHHVQAPPLSRLKSRFSFLRPYLRSEQPEWQQRLCVSRLCKSHYTVHGKRCTRIDPVLVTWLSVFGCGAYPADPRQGRGDEGRGDSASRRERERESKNGLKWERWGIWLNKMGDAATLLSKSFLRSLEWTEMKREANFKRKRGRGGRGGHTHPLPLWITVQKSYPISLWLGADDLMLLISQSIKSWCEFCVCDPHSLPPLSM